MEQSDSRIIEFKVDGQGLEYIVIVTFVVSFLVINFWSSIADRNTMWALIKFFCYSPLLMKYYIDIYNYRYRVTQKIAFTQCHLILTCRAKTYKLDLNQIEITKKSFGNSRFRKEFHICTKSSKYISRIKTILSKEHQCFKALIEEEYVCELEELLHELQVDYNRY